jgi:hypothetical protein
MERATIHRILAAIAILFVSVRSAPAQTAPDRDWRPVVGGGTLVALHFNNSNQSRSFFSPGNDASAVPGFWVELGVPVVSRPAIGFRIGAEFRMPVDATLVHGGTGGYEKILRHREALITAAMTFQSSRRSASPIWIVGTEVVSGRTTGLVTIKGWAPQPSRPIDEYRSRATGIVAGVDLPQEVNHHLAVIWRVRARFTFRDDNERDDGYGRLSVTPGFGLRRGF